jgi:hypothetical protein
MNDTQETVVEEYEQGYRVVREDRNYPDLYHFEGPKGRVKSFENPHEARLYADMYVITGGFNEKQTGNRGVPPAIVSASEEIRMTYLAVQMSIPYAARAFAVQESVVRDAVDRTHARAGKERLPTDEDA